MRYKVLAVLALFIVLLNFALAQKVQKKAQYTHNFPPQMTDDIKKSYVELFEKGKVLYGLNCSQCHDTVKNGLLTMPEYTKEHLAQYELRLQNPKHEESLSEMRVTAEELQQIMIFLTYYKKVEKAGKPGKR